MSVVLMDGLGPFLEACAAASRAIDDDAALRARFEKIKASAREVGRSWSGSTLGYHGNVYYAALAKPPPGARFSVEWGLMEQGFGFHDGTVGDWEEFDPQVVRDEVLRRAGAADPRSEIDAIQGRCKAAAAELKHEAFSTIDALLSAGNDPSLTEIRNAIEKLPEVDFDMPELGLMRGSAMSRDMRAMSQGARVFPAHLVLIAQIDSAGSHCKQAAQLVALIRRLDSYVRKKELVRSMSTEAKARDPKAVFVIYGRNTNAYAQVEKFLMAVGLRPLTFQEARRKAGAQPSVFDIVKYGVSSAQAVIALFTPDEWSALAPAFHSPSDRDAEKARWQARPNVPFEAGLAMGLNPAGTILATLGAVELPSDIAGLHQFRLSNDATRRHELRLLLKQLGCLVDEDGAHFLDPSKAGDFVAPTTPPIRDPFAT